MGIFRYIVQGIGWEIGSQAAREGLDAVRDHDRDERDREAAAAPPPLTAREQAKLDKARAQAAEQARKERDAAIARKQAEIEAQLAELKKKIR